MFSTSTCFKIIGLPNIIHGFIDLVHFLRVILYNTRREKRNHVTHIYISHGFGTRPVKRSRHGVRATKLNGGYQGQINFSSRDWKRRIDYFKGLVDNRPHLVETYISKLAPKTLFRLIKHVGQQGIPGNVQQAFNVLRRHFLKSFPPPEITERKIHKPYCYGIHEWDFKCSPFTWAAYAS